MGTELSITLLAAAVFVLLLVFTIIRSLRMPASFFEKQRQRDDLRRAILKKRYIPAEDTTEENEN